MRECAGSDESADDCVKGRPVGVKPDGVSPVNACVKDLRNACARVGEHLISAHDCIKGPIINVQ